MDKRVTLTIAVDRGHGPIEFAETFQDADIALAWLNGYLGIGTTIVTTFRIEREGDTQ